VGVVHGDAADQDLMESENITGTDAVVTLTDLDEMNMIVSLYATAQKVPQVITKLGSMVKHGIMDTLDLGSVICPKELCCNSIVRYVRAMQNQTGAAVSLHTIADGRSEAVEFLVESNAPYCGVPLKDLKLKPNVLIVSITHGSQTEIPNGNSQFQEGDTLVVVTSGRGILRRFDDIFA
jgi:trk system potassium uptake protein TrkA